MVERAGKKKRPSAEAFDLREGLSSLGFAGEVIDTVDRPRDRRNMPLQRLIVHASNLPHKKKRGRKTTGLLWHAIYPVASRPRACSAIPIPLWIRGVAFPRCFDDARQIGKGRFPAEFALDLRGRRHKRRSPPLNAIFLPVTCSTAAITSRTL